MENCGGGQRLPPDGDEFPATYQEFSNVQQQYQFVNGAPVTTATKFDHQIQKNNDSNVTNCQEKTILLQDSRVISLRSSVCCTSAEITLPMQNDYSYHNDKNIVLSEKKITISGYYNDDDESKAVAPPPLPTSRPPKVEVSRSIQPHRKFSLNGDSWRQDDKSEKSVRDKIAMFSSRGSVEAPLFPIVMSPSASSLSASGRRLSKYKSSEDVFNDEPKSQDKEKTRSSLDLTTSVGDEPPSLPLTSPPGSPTSKISSNFISETKMERDAVSRSNSLMELKPSVPIKATTSYVVPTGLTRATSFSGGSSSLHSRSQSLSDLPPNPGHVSRTNSLASNFRRPNDEMRRTSLNQLIEQRRKGISKLRGLVIPEKETLPVTRPIVDLPEIKSRDSILLQVRV